MIGKCKDCGKFKILTRHSLIGGHRPPFIKLCRKCHDIRHNINLNKVDNKIAGRRKYGKYQKGTPKHKRK